MMKFGVTDRIKARRILQLEADHRGWWPYALTLLEDLERNYRDEDEPLVERLYQGLSAGDGVWKITRSNRFVELDERTAEEINRRFGPEQPIIVHDMAVSNGVTSLEFYRRLTASRPITFFASDYYDRLTLVTPPSSTWTVAFDVDDRPLQCSNRRWAITCQRDELRRHPVNRLLQRQLRRKVVPAAVEYLANARSRMSDPPEANGIREVSLFHPRCLSHANGDEDFRLLRHDLFTPNPHSCHLVRVMNALTPHHFHRSQLDDAVCKSIENLAIGGLFLVGRSIDEEDGRTAATMYERLESGLKPIWDVNDGCEIKDVIAAATSSSQPVAN